MVLVFIGWINIYASIHSSEPSSIFDFDSRSGKQFVWMVTAMGIAGLILFVIPPRIYLERMPARSSILAMPASPMNISSSLAEFK